MNMMTAIISPTDGRLVPPLSILRALPPGPLAKKWAHLENARRLAPLFAAFDRDDMELAVDMLLAELDASDGDPDVEPNGDELDGTDAEDEEGSRTMENGWLIGVGCPIADPGEPAGDEHDTGNAEDEELTAGAVEWATSGGGCELSDGFEPSLAAPEDCSGRWGATS